MTEDAKIDTEDTKFVANAPAGKQTKDTAVLNDSQMDDVTLTTAKALAECKKVKIRLHQNPKHERQLPDETVQLNGHTYQIPRGISVEVPEPIYEILEEAGRL